MAASSADDLINFSASRYFKLYIKEMSKDEVLMKF